MQRVGPTLRLGQYYADYHYSSWWTKRVDEYCMDEHPSHDEHNKVKPVREPQGKVHLAAATANVQSLGPVELRRCQAVGLAYNEEIRRLDHDFFTDGLDIIGIQESCVQGDVERA